MPHTKFVKAPKRKYNSAKAGLTRKYGKSKAVVSASVLQAAIRRTLFKNAESKNSQATAADNQQISHNNAVIIATNVLQTTPGVQDPENQNTLNRIGDRITLLKVQFRMMLEINERFSDVTYRILLVRSARGDTPTNATLFNQLSGNRMLDTINYERHSVLYQKWGKIKAAPESGGRAAFADNSTVNPLTGVYEAYNDPWHGSKATRIVKFDVPGKKFAKDGIIIYENNAGQQKFFDYNLIVYAYSSYNTSEAAGYYVLSVNDYYHRLIYKDF